METIYQKIWMDLWGNKARTLQVALVVALGAFGIGLVVGARNLIIAAFDADWQMVAAPTINLTVDPPLTEEQLVGLKNIEGVEEVEGLVGTLVEWRASPEEEWQTAFLNARTDYLDQKMSKEFLVSGQWPSRNSVGIALGSDTYFGINQGDTIWLRINDRERQVHVGGVIKSLRAAPFFTGNPDFFTTRARFAEWLGEADYNTVQVGIGEFDLERAEAVDTAIKERLDKLDIDSKGANQPLGNRISPPDVQPAGALLDGMFAIMGLVGGVIIFLGLFLVFNSVSAIITQQINQIGVMKAIGGRTGQILKGYLLLILAYGLLATLISVPLGALAANALKNFFLGLTNTTNPGFQVDPLALSLQVVVSLLAPLAAALFPVLKGVHLTVREAISSYGLSGSAGLLDRLVARARGIPYSLLLMVGNTFRNKQRVFLIQATLIGSGMIFMIIMGVFDSTSYTFDRQLKSIHTYQAGLAFETPERLQRLQAVALSQPGVTAVELWNTATVTIRPSTQAEPTVDDEQALLLGLPPDTTFYQPQIEKGRWLQPGEEEAVVIHKALAEKVGLEVGDPLILTRDGDKDSTWRIVGILFDPVTNRSIYLPREALSRFLGEVNQANALWARTAATDAGSTQELALALEREFEARNIAVAPETVFAGKTIDDISYSKRFTYNLLVQLLAIMAVVIAIVGGVGLSGVLTLSVLERTREIGVMRAIGASSGQISRLFIGEGLLLGLLSWLVALPLSVPLSYTLTTQILTTILEEEISYRFTLSGPLLWLVVIISLAVIASWFPARRATRLSVRESLAYL
jgi:putative ABC transport system permease protein